MFPKFKNSHAQLKDALLFQTCQIFFSFVVWDSLALHGIFPWHNNLNIDLGNSIHSLDANDMAIFTDDAYAPSKQKRPKCFGFFEGGRLVCFFMAVVNATNQMESDLFWLEPHSYVVLNLIRIPADVTVVWTVRPEFMWFFSHWARSHYGYIIINQFSAAMDKAKYKEPH